jgi:hypothetical protein
VTVPLSGRREDDFERIDAVARSGAGLLACKPPGTYILAHSRHLRGTTGICALPKLLRPITNPYGAGTRGR